MGQMIRQCVSSSVALTTSAATTPEVSIADYASGQIHIPTGSSITTLTYHSAPNSGGTYRAAQDAAGAAVTQTVAAAKSYPIPAILFGGAQLRIVADAAGTVDITLKS